MQKFKIKQIKQIKRKSYFDIKNNLFIKKTLKNM